MFTLPLAEDPGRSRGMGGGHEGIDYLTPVGTPVLASADGWVIRTVNEPGGYGCLVELGHDDSWVTRYAHLTRTDVWPGQGIRQGELVGLSGGSPGDPCVGSSTGPHLHFETRQYGYAVDPDLVLGPPVEQPPAVPPAPPKTAEDPAMLLIQNSEAPAEWWLLEPSTGWLEPVHESVAAHVMNQRTMTWLGLPPDVIVSWANRAAAQAVAVSTAVTPGASSYGALPDRGDVDGPERADRD